MDTKLKKALLTLLLIAVFALPAAYAQSDATIRGYYQAGEGPQLEVFASAFDGASSETHFGLRGSYPIGKRFALEGSLSRFGDFDVYLTDLSVKYYLKSRGRTGVYLLAGPGVAFDGGFKDSQATLHAGLGLEVVVSKHLYLRPEVRARSLTLDVNNVNADFALGVGWRF